MNANRSLNRVQVQEILGCGKTKFWELVSHNAFPNKFYLGRHIRIPLNDVENYRERRADALTRPLETTLGGK